MNKQDRIQKIRQRLDELREIYARDVKASHHEPGQTMAMIEMYERQLQTLEETDNVSVEKEVTLVSSRGDERTFKVVSADPDPFAGLISTESEIGAKLLVAVAGDKIIVGEVEYTVKQVKKLS